MIWVRRVGESEAAFFERVARERDRGRFIVFVTPERFDAAFEAAEKHHWYRAALMG